MKAIESTTRISFKNVLLATDFSPVSEAAFRYAQAITRRYGAKIFATHVVAPGETPMVPPENWGACQQVLEEAARREMHELSERLQGIPHETVLGYGGIWDSVSALIAENHIDLLVVGTHGRQGLERLLMGSVAEEIFRRAACPVLTVGPSVSASAAPEVDFKEIVFATDFSPEWRTSAAYAVSLAQDYQARLTLVHVVCEPVAGVTDMERITEARMKDLHAMVPHDAELWCRPEYVVDFGDPAQRILEAARERKADLIVLGVRSAARHLGAATHVGTATAHTVVSLAPCPVLSVRH